MAKWKFALGEMFETITQPEMRQALLDHEVDREQRNVARGVKYGRLQPPITGQAAGGVLQMGGDYPNTGPGGTIVQPVQPRPGYAWLMRRMSVTGLTAGTTPDIVNLHRATPGAQYTGGTLSNGIWQFNGNNFAYTFSFGEMVFLSGDTPVIVSVGTFASTARIVLSADFIETPQELMYKALG